MSISNQSAESQNEREHAYPAIRRSSLLKTAEYVIDQNLGVFREQTGSLDYLPAASNSAPEAPVMPMSPEVAEYAATIENASATPVSQEVTPVSEPESKSMQQAYIQAATTAVAAAIEAAQESANVV
jgi:hypothetical protein